MAMAVPDGFSFADAAAIPEVFVTAHEALIHLGKLTSGGWAHIHAAAGGVGSAAVMLAHALAQRPFSQLPAKNASSASASWAVRSGWTTANTTSSMQRLMLPTAEA
jgi:D-arabinose 1-dehydrogenase-like Zn-dependent alcohol dehydrogenase